MASLNGSQTCRWGPSCTHGVSTLLMLQTRPQHLRWPRRQLPPCCSADHRMRRPNMCLPSSSDLGAQTALSRTAAFVTSCAICLSGCTPAVAFDIPFLPQGPSVPASTFEEREKNFQESDFLRDLKEKTLANKTKHTCRNKRDLENKYCYRQAELGVGDCAGLRLIPGATKSGKQKPPKWLQPFVGDGTSKESPQKKQYEEISDDD